MQPKQRNPKKVFFSGVLLLSFSTLLVKLTGLLYKIPMLSYLGSEGMGYFHSAYEIYALFCIISTAGLPVALSLLISESVARGERDNAAHIYRNAMLVFLIIGGVGTALMWGFADTFCSWIKSENAAPVIRAIAPTVFFVCFSSGIRGYFQGYQKMLPTALSQLIEATGKLIFGLWFAKAALERGAATPEVAAAAGWGLTCGTALAALYLLGHKVYFSHKENKTVMTAQTPLLTRRSIVAQIGKLAIPMTLGASLGSLTKLVDMALILRRLQSIGYDEIAANQIYGSYTTLALSVFSLLPTLLNAVFLPLVPMLSAAIATKDTERQTQLTELSYRLTAFFAIPASIGIAAFSNPVLSLLFGHEPEAVAMAAPLLSVLGVSVFLSCMISATNSVLHAYQIVNRPILSMLGGAVLKIMIAYFLIGSPTIGIFGAPISTFFCNLAVVLLNFLFASRYTGKISYQKIFWHPLCLSVISVGGAYLGYRISTLYLGERAILGIAFILLAAVLYLLLSLRFGGLDEEDLIYLPGGKQILEYGKRWHLIPQKNSREKVVHKS